MDASHQLNIKILYEELIDRAYHIERAFVIRRHIKLHYSSLMPTDSRDAYFPIIKMMPEFFHGIEESLLWFLTIELHSRFLSGSKRGLHSLLVKTDNPLLLEQEKKLRDSNSEVIDYLKVQRDQHLVHADETSWEYFPNIFDLEYEKLISEIKILLVQVGKTIRSPRIPSDSERVARQTKKLFDELLKSSSDHTCAQEARSHYENGLKSFFK